MNDNIIHILPEQIINKIAAGEVVERPASAVKELVENSIDAGADKIIISIKNAGRDLIQVIDNGSGMTEGDALTAFERHATSKITITEDLEKIMTLGFRGEALASIAAVSMVELKTRSADKDIGIAIKINGGKVESRSPVNINQGTHIAIKNLFFNTPARRNFLKTPATENYHIVRTVKRFLLSKPQISFQLYNDDKVIFDCPGETLEERVKRVLGDLMTGGFVSVDHKLGDMHLFGFAGRPEAASNDRQSQYLFLNGRFIINKNINFAVFKAYGEMVDKQSYPPFVLYLKIDPKIIDVNVHPAKFEVRFANERVILNFFQQAIRLSLSNENIIPEINSSENELSNGKISPDHSHGFSDFVAGRNKSIFDKSFANSTKSHHVQSERTPLRNQITFSYTAPKNVDFNGVSPEKFRNQEVNSKTDTTIRPIWQFHSSYIFTEIKSGLIIIDQYRAHYRILYEKIIRNSDKTENWGSQQLLFPQNFELTLEDYIIFKEIEPYLERIGFVISPYSGHTICLEAIPTEVAKGDETEIISGIIDVYHHEMPGNMEVFEKFARSFSQKNAVKKGQKLGYAEMVALLDRLFACEQPYYTPDGKTIVSTVPVEELEQKFK